MERRIGSRPILYVITLFLIAQFAGLLLAVVSLVPSYTYITSTATQNSNPVSFIFWLIINIVVFILIIMLILRYYRGDLFFKLLEAYVIVFGSFFLFLILISDIFPSVGIVPISLASLLLAIGLFLYKNKTNKFRNVITLMTTIGAGIFIGISIGISFGFLVLYLLLGLFAIYDYLAVFVFKFMIPLAKEASNRNLAFMIGSSDIELLPKGRSARPKIKKEELSKISNAKIRHLISEGNMPVVSSVMLGNGDIMLPLTLVVGSYAVYANVFLSSMIIVGSVFGLMATILLLRKYRVGLPAIPPLFAFISIALVIVFILSRPLDYFLISVFAIASLLSLVSMLFTLRKMKGSRS